MCELDSGQIDLILWGTSQHQFSRSPSERHVGSQHMRNFHRIYSFAIAIVPQTELYSTWTVFEERQRVVFKQITSQCIYWYGSFHCQLYSSHIRKSIGVSPTWPLAKFFFKIEPVTITETQRRLRQEISQITYIRFAIISASKANPILIMILNK